MKIVVLDGYTLNPGDLSWDALSELGDLRVYERTPANLIIDRASEAEIVFTNKTPLSAETISKLPNLKYVGVLATGYNVVDVRAAVERGVIVTNIPAYGTHSVAQMVFALLLELSRGARFHSEAVMAGEWSNSPDFCFWKTSQVELLGKTIGIIGFGRIGRQVAKIADACGMNVLASDGVRENPPDYEGFAWAEIHDLLAESDVVSLHCPLTPETERLINRETLSRMKENSFLINTSRGPLVVDEDLADALSSGRIAGAGLDVLTVEPPNADNPLLGAKNCIITPHIAWATLEARRRLINITVENLKAFLDGKLVNTVGSQ